MKTLISSIALASLALTGCATASNLTQKASNGVKSVVNQVSQTERNQLERNKANVLAFYEMVFNKHQVRAGADKYIGDIYLQHNPDVPDGKEPFVQAFESFVKEFPQSKATVKRVVAEGDLVILHIHSQVNPQDKGQAVVDIFRLDNNGKIVEHWDVIQDVPAKTASGRSMF